MSSLMDYRWPGNVRELQNAIQFAFVRCNGNVIKLDDLPMELREAAEMPVRRGPSRKLDQKSVKAALIRTGGNKARAAKSLGVGRATLYRFLNDYPELRTAGKT
jgi:transcriptional regulator of acetoin/glycerol metabolism